LARAWQQLPNVKRLLDAINARAAAQRVEALKERHAFKTEWTTQRDVPCFPRTSD
jgi:GST-like protein